MHITLALIVVTNQYCAVPVGYRIRSGFSRLLRFPRPYPSPYILKYHTMYSASASEGGLIPDPVTVLGEGGPNTLRGDSIGMEGSWVDG